MIHRVVLGLLLSVGSLGAQTAITLTATTSPASGKPGVDTISVTASGVPAGNLVASQTTIQLAPVTSGAGPSATATASAVTKIVGTTWRISFVIPATVNVDTTTPYLVSVSGTTSTSAAFASSNKAALSVLSPATIVSAIPSSAQVGRALAVVITAQLTNFAQGVTQASFGAGVSVGVRPEGQADIADFAYGQFGAVTVLSPTKVLALLRIDPLASAGVRDITLKTGNATVTLTGGFTLTAPGVAPAPTVLTLASPTNPSSGLPGATLSVTASGFPAEAIAASQMSAAIRVSSPNGSWSVIPVTQAGAGTGDTRAISFMIPASISVTSPLDYLFYVFASTSNYGVLPLGTTVTSGNVARFTVTPSVLAVPAISTISPSSGTQGTSLPITIEGQNTNFAQGKTIVSLGNGITVDSLTVGSATKLVAQITISLAAATGLRPVSVTTGTEIAVMPNAFTVNAAAPPAVISNVAPATGQVGATVQATVTGQNTHFAQATTSLDFGLGIAINNIVVSNPTSLTATLVVAANATLGPRNVQAITGSETAALVNGFTVTPSTPSLTSVQPNNAQPGQSLAITILGSNTSFSGGTTQVNLGAGITVNGVSVTSATSLTAQLTIAPGAALGPRNLSIQTGTASVSLANAFAVVSPPSITSVSPATGQPGQTKTVTIGGAGTTFSQATSQVTAGDGIAVSSVVVASPTVLTATFTISQAALVGGRTVSVQTGAELAIQVNGFTVAAGAPQITSVNPTSGKLATAVILDIVGVNTSWVNGVTDADLGPGFKKNVVTVVDANHLQPYYTILPDAALGPRTLTITTGSQVITLPNAFTVTAGDPTLYQVAPTTGAQATTVDIGLVGLYTHWVNGTTLATFGAGISVGGGAEGGFGPVFVSDSRTATAHITINQNAVPGTRTVSVQTGTEVVSKAESFGVIARAPGPALTITSPAQSAIFNTPAITVQGTVSDSLATVLVNGVAATVSGNTFSALNVPLIEGMNLVSATGTNAAGGVSSANVSVTLDTTPPVARIDTPTDGAMLLASTVTVTGNVNDIVSGTVNDSQVSVTVNGVTASVSNRTFTVADLLLVRGQNTISVVARDRAGNQSQAQVKVTVQDPPQQQRLQIVSGNNQSGSIGEVYADPLVVVALDAIGSPVPNQQVTFNVERSEGMLLPAVGDAARAIVAVTDNNGLARVRFKAGNRTGVGNNVVSATAPGFGGEVMFCSSTLVGAPASIAIVMGDGQRGFVNQPLPMPFTAILYDKGGNPVPNKPVKFHVAIGGGNFAGGPDLDQLTDSDGKASATVVLGPAPGANSNIINVQFKAEQDWQNLVTFKASSTLPGDPAQTRVVGQVYDNARRPIPNATAKILGTSLSAKTDLQGNFAIPNAPVGMLTVIVDGSTSTRPERFPSLVYSMVAMAGQDNSVSMEGPVELPPLDTSAFKMAGGDQDVTLFMKGVPGYEMTVFAHSATFPDGSKTGLLGISQVAADKVPMPPPNGSSPRIFGTLQPPGVKFNPPIRVKFPNTEGLQPGTVIEVTSFDHDLEQFVTTGTARVTPDGQFIISDPGFGIVKSGWHGPIAPPPPPNCTSNCTCVDGQCR